MTGDKPVLPNAPNLRTADDLLPSTRAHHYSFAHQAFKQYVLDDPNQVFGIIGGEDRDAFIAYIWERVCEFNDPRETTELSASEIRVTPLMVKECPTILVEMPPPMAMAEAIMVAVVLTSKELGPDVAKEDATFRYFTLELGIDSDEGLRTVLCEWNADMHMNLGDGPEATASAFLNEVENRLN